MDIINQNEKTKNYELNIYDKFYGVIIEIVAVVANDTNNPRIIANTETSITTCFLQRIIY